MPEIQETELRKMAAMKPDELKRYVAKMYREKRQPIFYGYARVSTRGQVVNGNSIEEQHLRLEREGCEVIVEEQYTGRTVKRPKFDELLSQLREGDTLVVTRLDRLARNVIEGCKVINDLQDRGVTIKVLNLGVIDNSTMGKFFVQVLLAAAEMERNTIIERMQEGKAIARTKKGYREGRPPIPKARKDAAVKMIMEQHMTYTETEKATGLSRSTLIRSVRKAKDQMTHQQ